MRTPKNREDLLQAIVALLDVAKDLPEEEINPRTPAGDWGLLWRILPPEVLQMLMRKTVSDMASCWHKKRFLNRKFGEISTIREVSSLHLAVVSFDGQGSFGASLFRGSGPEDLISKTLFPTEYEALAFGDECLQRCYPNIRLLGGPWPKAPPSAVPCAACGGCVFADLLCPVCSGSGVVGHHIRDLSLRVLSHNKPQRETHIKPYFQDLTTLIETGKHKLYEEDISFLASECNSSPPNHWAVYFSGFMMELETNEIPTLQKGTTYSMWTALVNQLRRALTPEGPTPWMADEILRALHRGRMLPKRLLLELQSSPSVALDTRLLCERLSTLDRCLVDWEEPSM